MKNIVVLGSTGSIGVAALEVIKKLGPGYRVLGLATRANVELLLAQARAFRPRWVSVFEPEAAARLSSKLPRGVKLLSGGVESLMELAAHPDTDLVVSGLSGGVGFGPLVAAVKAGKTVALANKEPLVMAGQALMAECRRWNSVILPVDSEASAVFQALDRRNQAGVSRVLLTASGGPFFRYKGNLDKVTVAQALRHPRWRMGKKITVDSATLMNKGFEAIEIAKLFSLPVEKIEIVIHPQSIVHSAVEHEDGAVLAQLSLPDMRLPIQYAI
ncbi:MAG TPA: 1-deoxy-D-xylulose-5-phosphate reductoisomerase, partial [Elusimicrobiales bacterium]|nr:1-deoxy-D-xylulose-5-phosphate reductoisomerase [Elusimicrobiales bacterium]